VSLLKDVPEALRTPELCLAAQRTAWLDAYGYNAGQLFEHVPEALRTPEQRG